MRELIDVLSRHGDSIGRDTDRIEKTVMMSLVYTPEKEKQDLMSQLLGGAFGLDPAEARDQMMIGGRDECLEKVNNYREAGCTHFIFMTFPPYALDEMQAFSEEVIPAARDL